MKLDSYFVRFARPDLSGRGNLLAPSFSSPDAIGTKNPLAHAVIAKGEALWQSHSRIVTIACRLLTADC